MRWRLFRQNTYRSLITVFSVAEIVSLFYYERLGTSDLSIISKRGRYANSSESDQYLNNDPMLFVKHALRVYVSLQFSLLAMAIPCVY